MMIPFGTGALTFLRVTFLRVTFLRATVEDDVFQLQQSSFTAWDTFSQV